MRFVRSIFRTLFSFQGLFFGYLLMSLLINAGDAFAAPPGHGAAGGSSFENIDDYATSATNNTSSLVEIFNYVSFILGVLTGALGINELRRVVDGSGNIPLRQPLAKLFFSGLFLALPMITAVVQETMAGDDSLDFQNIGAFYFGSLNIDDKGLSGIIQSGVLNMSVAVQVAAYAAFVIGVFFTLRGLQLLKTHIENPGNAPLPEGLKRLFVGGALLSFPMIAKVVRDTFGVTDGGALGNTGWASKNAADGGLDGMMLHFVQDLANPAYRAIEIFSFIAGVVMILFALQRLVRSLSDGPRGPLGFGTIMMFFVAGALISFPQLLNVLNTSILGGSAAETQVHLNFMSEMGGDAEQTQNAVNVFSAVLAFMAVIGYLSIVRGLFMIRSLAEGGQVSLMQVVVHLVAGSIAVNLGAFINVIQHSLGLTSFAVSFS